MGKQVDDVQCREAHDVRMAHLASCLEVLSTDATEYLYVSDEDGAVVQQYSAGGWATLEELDEEEAQDMLIHFIDVSVCNLEFFLGEGFELPEPFQERLSELLESIKKQEE